MESKAQIVLQCVLDSGDPREVKYVLDAANVGQGNRGFDEVTDTVAYVRDNRAPIHFCPAFRTDRDRLGRQGDVIHEFAQLTPGADDSGGYAMPLAQAIICSTGVKFSAASDVLTHTADALTGFVLHVGQQSDVDVRVS